MLNWLDSECLPQGKGLKIGNAVFTPNDPLIIAELGTGHGGMESKAEDLILSAKEAGADCAKFQAVFAEEILRPETGLVKLPTGNIPLYDTFKALEKDRDFYLHLKETTEKAGLIFLCTPFGTASADMLNGIGVSAMKIASPELNHVPLLKRIASFGLPTIVSSGVTRLADIELALDLLENLETALLHCVTSYPAPESEYNLLSLDALSTLFGVPVGVSDHSLDPVLVPALSVLCGGCVIEKHFTLSKSDGGLDDPIALEPNSFRQMTSTVRSLAGGSREYAMKEIMARYGHEAVRGCLGSGKKELAGSESANYSRTNRSLHATREIAKGELLDADNMTIARTEKILRPGIEPRFMDVAIGRIAARDIPSGEGIRWEDLGGFA